ncbi:DUF6907 domain-containing protein [Plantactinospora sp. WMMB334]|uniref:DUF6907 domain-containing protein n=1 Tax=Plantactinospora sp. WMMB334 TaxID=3404119 RepID=UPI003B9316A5
MTLAPVRPDVAAPVFIAPATLPSLPPCPEYCDGTCFEQWYDAQSGTTYHGSPFTEATVTSPIRGEETLSVSVTRTDTLAGPGEPVVHAIVGDPAFDDIEMTPEQARRVATLLLAAADIADGVTA